MNTGVILATLHEWGTKLKFTDLLNLFANDSMTITLHGRNILNRFPHFLSSRRPTARYGLHHFIWHPLSTPRSVTTPSTIQHSTAVGQFSLPHEAFEVKVCHLFNRHELSVLISIKQESLWLCICLSYTRGVYFPFLAFCMTLY